MTDAQVAGLHDTPSMLGRPGALLAGLMASFGPPLLVLLFTGQVRAAGWAAVGAIASAALVMVYAWRTWARANQHAEAVLQSFAEGETDARISLRVAGPNARNLANQVNRLVATVVAESEHRLATDTEALAVIVRSIETLGDTDFRAPATPDAAAPPAVARAISDVQARLQRRWRALYESAETVAECGVALAPPVRAFGRLVAAQHEALAQMAASVESLTAKLDGPTDVLRAAYAEVSEVAASRAAFNPIDGEGLPPEFAALVAAEQEDLRRALQRLLGLAESLTSACEVTLGCVRALERTSIQQHVLACETRADIERLAREQSRLVAAVDVAGGRRPMESSEPRFDAQPVGPEVATVFSQTQAVADSARARVAALLRETEGALMALRQEDRVVR